MKILVGQHELQIDKKDKVNQNEYKITKCEFEFDEAITNDLVKIALFTNSAGTYKEYIINNECDIPAEILAKQETTTLGVYAYKVEQVEENGETSDILKLRYSPEEIKFYVSNGSYKENAENTEPITPTDKEQMEQALQNGLNDINDKIDEVDEKLDGIDTAIEETNNLNLDVSDKVDGDVTVTLTKKDASTKTVVLSDGTSLEFNWDGTKLGIKTSDEEEYIYVDLQGIQGIPGPQGEPFRIKKTYSSVAEMNADFNNMEYGDYVMIASTVEIEDNAKLYTRGETQWIFITDFSGATGIRGPVGPTPNIQVGTVTSGSTPSVTRSGTDENPVLNFVLQKGDKGDKGNTGDTGNGISSIEKTSTSGLVDTYTITYTNGNTTTFNVSNGNGIDRIEKTATVGNKDTYTIYFTNGSTTTYEVSNGEVTREELEEEVERLSMIYNAFPSTTGEGEEPSINGTAEVPFKEIGLKGNTSQESTTQSANLFDEEYYNNDSLYSINTYKYTKLKRIKERGTLYFKAQLKTGKSEIGSFYLCLSNKVNPNTMPNNTAWAIYGTIVADGSTIQRNYATFDTSDDLYFSFYPVTVAVDTIFDTYDFLISTNNISYVPFVPDSPSPDYPQDVHVVSGDNTIEVRANSNLRSGEQLYQTMYAYNSSNVIEVTDGNVNAIRFNPYYYRPLGGTNEFNVYNNWKENTQYTIRVKAKRIETAGLYLQALYTDGTNSASQIAGSTTEYTELRFVTSANKTIQRVGFSYGTQGEWLLDKSSWYIGEGNQNEYPEYQGSNYQVNLPIENLAKTTFDKPWGISGSGNARTIKTNSSYYNRSEVVKVKSNTTYTISGDFSMMANSYIRILDFDSEPQVGSTSTKYDFGASPFTFTTDTNTQYIVLYNSENVDTVVNYLQLEEGTKQNSFTPYGTTPIELCKIGDYQDYIYKQNGNWYKYGAIGKYTFTGNETLEEYSGAGAKKITNMIVAHTFESNATPLGYSNISAMKSRASLYTLSAEGLSYSNNEIYLYFANKTSQEILNILKNTDLHYLLATPTITPITDTTLIEQLDNLEKAYSYDTQTNISQTNQDKPFIISYEAILSLRNVLNS